MNAGGVGDVDRAGHDHRIIAIDCQWIEAPGIEAVDREQDAVVNHQVIGGGIGGLAGHRVEGNGEVDRIGVITIAQAGVKGDGAGDVIDRADRDLVAVEQGAVTTVREDLVSGRIESTRAAVQRILHSDNHRTGNDGGGGPNGLIAHYQ